jgi:hypothetical protein
MIYSKKSHSPAKAGQPWKCNQTRIRLSVWSTPHWEYISTYYRYDEWIDDMWIQTPVYTLISDPATEWDTTQSIYINLTRGIRKITKLERRHHWYQRRTIMFQCITRWVSVKYFFDRFVTPRLHDHGANVDDNNIVRTDSRHIFHVSSSSTLRQKISTFS